MDKCGSYAGYNVHQREGTEVCEPCALARNIYMANWRRNRNGSRGKRSADGRVTRLSAGRCVAGLGWPP